VSGRIVATAPGAPEVRLLDARARGLDRAGLRAWARQIGEACGGRQVSRSYRYPYALVAWHDRPVGADIERLEPCDEAFAEVICTPSERIDPALAADRDRFLSSLWCSKEALSKALGDALLYDPARLPSPAGWPDGAAGPWRATSLSLALAEAEAYFAWLCWRA
jgi:hypothetical protein